MKQPKSDVPLHRLFHLRIFIDLKPGKKKSIKLVFHNRKSRNYGKVKKQTFPHNIMEVELKGTVQYSGKYTFR